MPRAAAGDAIGPGRMDRPPKTTKNLNKINYLQSSSPCSAPSTPPRGQEDCDPRAAGKARQAPRAALEPPTRSLATGSETDHEPSSTKPPNARPRRNPPALANALSHRATDPTIARGNSAIAAARTHASQPTKQVAPLKHRRIHALIQQTERSRSPSQRVALVRKKRRPVQKNRPSLREK